MRGRGSPRTSGERRIKKSHSCLRRHGYSLVSRPHSFEASPDPFTPTLPRRGGSCFGPACSYQLYRIFPYTYAPLKPNGENTLYGSVPLLSLAWLTRSG